MWLEQIISLERLGVQQSTSHPEWPWKAGSYANEVNLTYGEVAWDGLGLRSCPPPRCWRLRQGLLHFGTIDLRRGYILLYEHRSFQSRIIVASIMASEQVSCLSYLGLFPGMAVLLCFPPMITKVCSILTLSACYLVPDLLALFNILAKYTSRVW